MTHAKSPQDAVNQFWEDVKGLLIKKGHTDEQSRKGINLYREELNRRKVGKAAYNQGEERVAEVIHEVILNKGHLLRTAS